MLKRIIVIEGVLHFTSPLIIGSGDNDSADIVVLKDLEGSPYIPGTSLAGALRHYFYNNINEKELNTEQARYFWGGGRSDSDADFGQQSFLYVSDLKPRNKTTVVVRDGVKIGPYGIVEDQMKYDYEVVEPGVDFGLHLEVKIMEKIDYDYFQKILTSILTSMEECKIFLGAMTTKGFGRFILKQVKIWKYDFARLQDVFAWLAQEKTELQKTEAYKETGLEKSENDFSLEAVFKIKNSLIVRSYSTNAAEPDATHIKSAGRNVLPGTSIKGAIRTRANRIINTIGDLDDEELHELFGWASDKKKEKKFKSRLIVEETFIQNVCREIQARVKIDRFTGGVINAALFDSMPLWPKADQDDMVTIKIKVKNCKPWEAGLMLLILKDLWTGDLPIGGEKSIGRGVLEGLSVRINYDNKKYEIVENCGQLHIIGNKKELETLINALTNKCLAKEKEGIKCTV